MDFDDGNWNFRGVLSVVGGSSPMRSPWSFKSKYVAVDLAAKKVKDTWYRSGYIRFESNGLQIPNKEPLSFGRTVLTAPDFPDQQSYRILFTPVQWLGNGRLRFWEFIPTRKAVRPSPIDPREFTSQEIELLQTSGLDPEKLRLSPESLEIVLPLLISLRTPQSGSILTEIKTLIEQLSTMASTDIRTMLQNLEAIGTQTMSNAADLAAQSVTLADVKATAVVEKNFTIAKAAFLLEGNVYRAPIAHMMRSRSPGVTIYDADGDLQLAEFIVVDLDNAKLELSAGQFADNSFPLTVNLQAKVGSTLAAGMNEYAINSLNMKYRYNPAVNNGTVEKSDIGSDVWTTHNNDTDILEAFINGIVLYGRNSGGIFKSVLNDGGRESVSQADYDTAKSTGVML